MALARTRQAARRVKDRWKAKSWYTVVAPASFNNRPIGETFADEPAKLMGRRVETSMQEMTGDMKQMHIKLNFQVTEVVDNQARTVFDGHNMTSDYVRRLTRRGHTKIGAVFDLKTKDDCRIRVKPFCVTDRRCQTTQAQAIRNLMQTMLKDAAADLSLSGFLKAILTGDLTNTIYKEARKIHPVRRIEVARTEILRAPSIEMDETPVFSDAPEPSEDSEEGEDGEATDAVEIGDDSEEETLDDSEEE